MKLRKLNGLSIETSEELKEVTARMSCFAANGSHEYVSKLMEHLALHSLAKLPPGFRKATVIYENLIDLIDIPIDFMEILPALDRLSNQKAIEKRFSDEQAEYKMEVDRTSEITQEYKEYLDRERQIFDEWSKELLTLYPDLTSSDVETLKGDLETVSLRFYSQHSVQNLVLYFGDNKDLDGLLEEMDKTNLLDLLASRDEKFDRIAKVEIPRFFRSAKGNRREYIAKQLNSTFVLNMFQLDPKCVEMVSKHLSGGYLFLDTNFIYRLLGINGATLRDASQKLLEQSKTLGYICVVSPRTIEEYKSSLESAVRKLDRHPQISPQLAHVARSVTADKDFITHYWKNVEERKGAFSVDAFYQFYNQITVILKETFEIEVNIMSDEFIRSNPAELSREESLLLSTLPGWTPSHDSILEHDAWMRLLILALRQGGEELSPLETRFWFLTCDTKLTTYDRRARPRLHLKVPFCVMASQWAQLISPFSTTNEEYALSLAAILESPLFRSLPTPSPETVQEIISLMAVSEGYPPSVTARILLDGAFVRTFSEKSNEQERREYFEDYFFGTFVTTLEKEQEQTLEEMAQLQSKLTALDGKIAQSQEENQKIDLERQKLTAQIVQSAAQADDLKQQLFDAKSIHEIQSKQINTMLGEITTLRNEIRDSSASKWEIEDLKKQFASQNTKQEDERKRQLIREQKNTKIITILIVWAICVLLLSFTAPWNFALPSKNLLISIPIIAIIITQGIMLWGRVKSRVTIGILLMINLVGLLLAILMPFGVGLPDIFSAVLYIATLIAGVYTFVPFIKDRP